MILFKWFLEKLMKITILKVRLLEEISKDENCENAEVSFINLIKYKYKSSL